MSRAVARTAALLHSASTRAACAAPRTAMAPTRRAVVPHASHAPLRSANTSGSSVRCMGTTLSQARAITAVDTSAGGRHHVATIDTRYPGPMSAFLVVDAGRAAFVDVNTRFAVPWLLQALEELGMSHEDVDFIAVTHVHLDHSGGTAELLRHCPNATVLAHPRAASHLVDPTRLVGAVRQVYGDEAFDVLYGDIDPIDSTRVRSMDDGASVQLGECSLSFLHTRGHANHHTCVVDRDFGGVFSGDSFGIAYPANAVAGEFDGSHHTDGERFMFPGTAPADYDTEEALKAVDNIAAEADRVYLAHYGSWDDIPEGVKRMHRGINAMQEVIESADAAGVPNEFEALQKHCEKGVRAYFKAEMQRLGIDADAALSKTRLLSDSAALNGQGLAVKAMKLRR